MKLSFNQTLQNAVTAHKEGKLEEATRLYQELLKFQPLESTANNNLGTILYNNGKLTEAETSFR